MCVLGEKNVLGVCGIDMLVELKDRAPSLRIAGSHRLVCKAQRQQFARR